ncbi:DUF2510 domain-containing protein [Demequina sp. NBRC 110054]|uniref:DUF2510 domain-containing protein n=1 Tax=Demequina sp. NBRC 110054 TaxID=1570343 RepID=UPI000A0362B2|nr:DUF2510 domain-containing protein [Demequina sp. NBRC 110054]
MTDASRSSTSLRPAGWLPDPMRPGFERYWDGQQWTLRVRDRETGVEVGESSGGAPRPGSRRRAIGWTATLAVFAAIVAGVGWMGALPSWIPWPDALVRPAPSGPEVAYPVYGSDELVTYLARSMVAQEETIDLSWMAFTDEASEETIPDAVFEAVTQNPYVFVEGWEWSIGYPKAVLEPIYTYDDTEAERRRRETAAEVASLVADASVTSAVDDRALATAVHDLVVSSAVYDYAAADAVIAGETTATSPRVARSQEAYGILVEGSAVCNGYAQAFQLLADAVGLDSVIVTGTADGGVTTGLHAWNLVQIDDEWLVVDTTWDDAGLLGTGREYLLLDQSSEVLDTRAADADWIMDGREAAYLVDGA